MRLGIAASFLKVPLVITTVLGVSVIACFVMTDPAPSTLPRRARRFVADVGALLNPTSPRPIPSPPLTSCRSHRHEKRSWESATTTM